MNSLFPECIRNLPRADVPIKGVNIFISQATDHQIVFMEFHETVTIPKHSHQAQWEIVLNGSVEVWIDDTKQTFRKGDQFYIPAGTVHHALVSKGYACIAFFDEPNRYQIQH